MLPMNALMTIQRGNMLVFCLNHTKKTTDYQHQSQFPASASCNLHWICAEL